MKILLYLLCFLIINIVSGALDDQIKQLKADILGSQIRNHHRRLLVNLLEDPVRVGRMLAEHKKGYKKILEKMSWSNTALHVYLDKSESIWKHLDQNVNTIKVKEDQDLLVGTVWGLCNFYMQESRDVAEHASMGHYYVYKAGMCGMTKLGNCIVDGTLFTDEELQRILLEAVPRMATFLEETHNIGDGCLIGKDQVTTTFGMGEKRLQSPNIQSIRSTVYEQAVKETKRRKEIENSRTDANRPVPNPPKLQIQSKAKARSVY